MRVVLLAAFLCGCTSAFFLPSRALYRRPEELGLKYDTVQFPSTDGTELTGLFLHASTSPVRGTVVHFHGNAENMTSHFGYSYWLTALGFNVFVFDYRGYGASAGAPTQDGLVQDGIAALRNIRQRKDVDPEKIAVWGQSLGAAVAVASLTLGEASGIRAVVLESPFDSYKSMAQDVLSRSALTWPLQWPLRLLVSDRHKPAKYASRLPRCPVLVLHGDADEVIPFRLGERFYRRLPEPKTFWRVEGARHLEATTRFASQYRPRLAEFLKQALSEPLRP